MPLGLVPQSGFGVHDDSADRLVDFTNRHSCARNATGFANGTFV
jgi:hypothetical protein